jgi:hypothetical protein
MPTSSPGAAPAGTIETLGLPTRAVTALTRAGITDVAALAALTRRELSAVPGLGAGLVTAIRRVVPEPPAVLPGTTVPPGTAGAVTTPAEPAAAAGAGGNGAPPTLSDDDAAGPASPEIPSFASLRDPRRRTALDLLVPAPEPAPAPAAGTQPDPGSAPRPEPAPGPGPGPRRPAAAPRPAEYADLLRLGVRLARAAVTAPGRVALWSVRTQVDLLRRLLGA